MGATNTKTSGAAFDQIKSVAKPIYGRNKNLPISSSQKSRANGNIAPFSTDKAPRFVENVILVWLDASLEKPNESTIKSLNQIRRVTNIMKLFFELEKCFQFISSIKDEKVFLIVSGSFGPQIVPRMENFDQVHSIFIYCGNKANHEQWTKQHKKIKSLHTQIKELCETLKYNIRQYDKSLTSISILPASGIMKLNESNKEFIFIQVMKSILIEMHYEKKFRREFMDYARRFYLDNDYQLNLIDTFDSNYDLHTPIWWYTRRCCIYTMLRRAFAMNDFEIVYKLAFFVRDLHRDIKKSYLQVHNHQHHPISVYRTTRTTTEEYARIEKNHDGLLAFNDFLWTTLERSMALKFANSIRNDPNSVAIIYKINVDPVTSTVPYISLNNLSYLSNTEGEILFSMNTIFHIDRIERLNERLYEINLSPTGKKDEQIKKLVECIQEITANVPGWYKLSKILMDVNEYDQAESIYKYIYSQADDSHREERAFLQHELGYVQDLKNNLPAAVTHYKQAIEIYLKFLPANHSNLLSTYANLASVLQKQGDFQGASVYYQNALKTVKADDPNIVIQYNNTASLHQQQGKYSEAQQSYEKSIQILLRDFPSAQSILADTYHGMAGLLYSMKDYSKALANYAKVLAIEEKSVPPDQALLASTYFNMATAYEALQDQKKAAKYAEKAVEAACQAFGDEHLQTKDNIDYLEQLRSKSEMVKF